MRCEMAVAIERHRDVGVPQPFLDDPGRQPPVPAASPSRNRWLFSCVRCLRSAVTHDFGQAIVRRLLCVFGGPSLYHHVINSGTSVSAHRPARGPSSRAPIARTAHSSGIRHFPRPVPRIATPFSWSARRIVPYE
jgi:hypothetical protein